MTTAVYWSLFAAAAVLMLVVVPLAFKLERREDDARERARLERLERTEQARRRIRLGL